MTAPKVQEYLSRSEADTEAIATELARTLVAGDVVLLSGDLGTGKTAFVRGLATGLGADPAAVSSPTFALVHDYRGGRLRLLHADLYRLSAPRAVDDLDLDDARGDDAVLAIEWPERLPRPYTDAVTVHLSSGADDPESTRRIVIVGPPR